MDFTKEINELWSQFAELRKDINEKIDAQNTQVEAQKTQVEAQKKQITDLQNDIKTHFNMIVGLRARIVHLEDKNDAPDLVLNEVNDKNDRLRNIPTIAEVEMLRDRIAALQIQFENKQKTVMALSKETEDLKSV